MSEQRVDREWIEVTVSLCVVFMCCGLNIITFIIHILKFIGTVVKLYNNERVSIDNEL